MALTRLRRTPHPLADESVAAPERRRRYDEFFDLLDAVLEDGEQVPVLAARACAETLGLPHWYQASIGHLNVCLDATRPKRWWRPWTRLGENYVTVTDRYAQRVYDGRRMRPMMHGYETR